MAQGDIPPVGAGYGLTALEGSLTLSYAPRNTAWRAFARRSSLHGQRSVASPLLIDRDSRHPYTESSRTGRTEAMCPNAPINRKRFLASEHTAFGRAAVRLAAGMCCGHGGERGGSGSPSKAPLQRRSGRGMRRAQRLRHRHEFAVVYRHGRSYRSELLVLRALATGRPDSRFGFAVGKAVGNAVVRNRIKRRLREAVRTQPFSAGWDAVVGARRGAAAAPFQLLAGEVSRLMKRAGMLRLEDRS